MPQEPIQSFTYDGKTYNIPDSMVTDFLHDVPDAKPVKPDLSITKSINMGLEPNSQKQSLMPASLEQSIDDDQQNFAQKLAALPIHKNIDNLPGDNPYYDQAVKKPTPEPQHGLSKAIQDAGYLIQNIPQSIAIGGAKLLEGIPNQLVNLAGNARFTPGSGVYGVRPYTEPGERQEQAQATQQIQDKVSQVADDVKGVVAPGYNETQAKINEMNPMAKFIGHTTGGLAEFLPAMALSAPTGGASLYFSAYQDGLDQMKDKDVDPETRQLYAMGMGLANMALMKLPIAHALDKTVINKFLNKVVLESLAKVSKGAGGKLAQDEFLDVLNNVTQSSLDKVKAQGMKAFKSAAEGGIFSAAQQGVNYGLQQGVNATEGKKVFETPTLSDVGSGILSGSIGVGLLGHLSSAFSGQTGEYLQNRILASGSPEDLADIHAQVDAMAQKKKITPEQADNLHQNIDNYAGIVQTIPATVPADAKKQTADLIAKRQQLEDASHPLYDQLGQLNDQRNNLDGEDPALREVTEKQIDDQAAVVRKQIQDSEAARESINDRIREAATGYHYQYHMGEDDVPYKQLTTKGDKQPISDNQYEIEKANGRTGKQKAEAEQPQNIHTPQTPETTQTPKTPASETEPQPEEDVEQPKGAQPEESGEQPSAEQAKKPGIHVSAPEPELPETDKIAVKKPSASTNTVETNSKIHVETPEERFVPDKESKISVKLPKGKEDSNATTKSTQQQPEGNQPASIEEHQGTRTPRNETQEPAADNSNSGENGQGAEGPKTLTEPKPESNIKEGETKRIGKYNVTLKEGELHIRDDKGKEPSASTLRRVKKSYEEAYNYARGKRAPNFPEEDRPYITPEEHDNYLVEHSENPRELAEVYARQQPREPNVSFKEDTINQYGLGKVSYASFRRFGDKNQLDAVRGWIGKKSKGAGDIDAIAKEFSDMTDIEFTPQDIIDYMMDHRKGEDIGKGHINDIAVKAAEKFKALTGLKLNRDNAERISDYRHGEQPADASRIGKGPSGENLHPETTGIKNEVNKSEREAAGVKEVEVMARRTFGQVFDEGKRLVDTGELNIRSLTDSIIEKPRPLSAEQSVALLYDRMKISNEHEQAVDRATKAIKDGNVEEAERARMDMAVLEELAEKNDIAARLTGYEQGLGLAIRRLMIRKDYSMTNQLRLLKVETGGVITPELRAHVEELTTKLRQAEKELEEYRANKDEAMSLETAQKVVADMVSESKREQRQVNRQAAKEKILQSREAIKEELRAIARKQMGKLSANPIPLEMVPSLVKLAKNYIEDGIVTLEGVVDNVFSDVKDMLPDVTKRDVRDAISGYGRVRKPSKNEVEKQYREVVAQARLVSALEDAEQGERPKKSGFQRPRPSQKVRGLRKQVNEAMKKNGIEIRDIPEEERFRTALDAVKQRLRNQIEDLEKQIADGKKTAKRNGVEYDEEAKKLKARVDELKEIIQKIEGKPEIPFEQKVKMAEAGLERSITELERRINELDFKAKQKPDPIVTERLIELRARRKQLRDQYEAMKLEANPKRSPEEIAHSNYKKSLERRKARLKEKLDNKDYEPDGKPERKYELDKEDLAKQAEIEHLKYKLDNLRFKEKMKNRSTAMKWRDGFLAFRRGMLLSSVVTLGKLTMAATTRGITTPIEEFVGSGLRLLPGVSKIAARAPREGGGFNLKDEADAVKEIFSKGTANDLVKIFKTGRSQLDDLSGHRGHISAGNAWEQAMEKSGQMHQILKTPIKRAEFVRSFNKRMRWYERQGVDVSDPTVANTIAAEATQDAYRAIFMQDNSTVKDFNAWLAKQDNKKTFKSNVSVVTLRTLLPIVKVPTNYAGEVASGAFGLFKAMPDIYQAIRKGVDTLTPAQADFIMRNLKKQTIGIAMVALGYYAYDKLGGYWYTGRGREKDGPEPDTAELFGHAVPKWLMDAPIMDLLQIGATIHRIRNSYERHGKPTNLFTGVKVTGLSFLNKVPFARTVNDLVHAGETVTSTNKFVGRLLEGILVPPDVQRIARATDTDENGNPVVRKPDSWWEYTYQDVPGLRQTIKTKTKPKDTYSF